MVETNQNRCVGVFPSLISFHGIVNKCYILAEEYRAKTGSRIHFHRLSQRWSLKRWKPDDASSVSTISSDNDVHLVPRWKSLIKSCDGISFCDHIPSRAI